MIRRLLTAALLALLALINTQDQGGARSVSLDAPDGTAPALRFS